MKDLQALRANRPARDAAGGGITWRKFIEKSEPEFDADRQPVLRAPTGLDEMDAVELGVTRKGLQSEDAPADLQRELMIFRLKQTLARSRAPRISGNELREDWQLLEKIDEAGQEALSKKLDQENQSVSQ
jgi:hypothetical protein